MFLLLKLRIKILSKKLIIVQSGARITQTTNLTQQCCVKFVKMAQAHVALSVRPFIGGAFIL